MKKEIVVIRLNPLVIEWYKKQAEKEKMTKSEYIRKVLTHYKEQKSNESSFNN